MTEGVAGSPFVRFVLGCVSARNVRSPLYCFKKGFAVTVGVYTGNPNAVLANIIIRFIIWLFLFSPCDWSICGP